MSKMNDGDAEGITTFFKFNPYNQLSVLLTEWKQQPEAAFLKDYPVFRKRGVKDSFSFNGAIKHDAENNRIE